MNTSDDRHGRAPMAIRMLHSLHMTAKLIQWEQFCYQRDAPAELGASKRQKKLTQLKSSGPLDRTFGLSATLL
jgi:hypothetical protein